MKYCVIKNTVRLIDGSDNPEEVMYKNALNSGFKAEEVEIITEEEFQLRVDNTPKPPVPKTDLEVLKDTVDRILLAQLLEGGM